MEAIDIEEPRIVAIESPCEKTIYDWLVAFVIIGVPVGLAIATLVVVALRL